ncbi:hypothetical protein FKW77_001521 [Venturia effusa]|uniref:Uncharacterized protein n=1 Tax=Venturia effusa TaxID=50376 RepID=A0A517LI51_9PEZI|nr:hypothetical protein FKW77_001521 [Venturia effusa]
MAKITKPTPSYTPHAPGYFNPDNPRGSNTSDNTTLYETASESQPPKIYNTEAEPQLPKLDGESPEPHPLPKAKPHVSRSKLVRNEYGIWVPLPLETGKSEHGPWVPPMPVVEDSSHCCCVIL